MAAFRMCTRSLALLGLLGQSHGFEDVAALIQHRQAVEASSELQWGTRAIPAVGSDGFAVTRLSASGENGSYVVLNFSSFCDEDALGPTECAVYYEMPVHHSLKLHAAGGLSRGDKVDMSFNISLSHNETNFWSFLMPKNTFAHINCALCTGACHFSMVRTGVSLNITAPTVMDNLTMCDDTAAPVEDVTIMERNGFWTKPPAALDLSGDLTWSTGLFDESGDVRAQASYLLRVDGPDSPAGSMAAKTFRGDNTALDLWKKAFFDRVSGSAGGSSTSLKEFLGSGPHYLELNLTVNTIASGSSMSITASSGCNSTGAHGSVSCKIPLQGSVSLSSAANLSFVAAEGGTMRVTSTTSIAGNLGVILGDRLRNQQLTVPLCGTAPVTVTGPTGTPTEVTPMRCGAYALQFTSTGPLTSLADFGNFDLPRVPLMPFMPRTFDEMLPLSETIGLEMMDAANATMLSFELAIGIGIL